MASFKVMEDILLTVCWLVPIDPMRMLVVVCIHTSILLRDYVVYEGGYATAPDLGLGPPPPPTTTTSTTIG